MTHFKALYPIFLFFIFLPTQLTGADITICIDCNPWYPYSYHRNGTVKGAHVEIVMEACKNKNHNCIFKSYPWKRCLYNAKKGKVDAILSASFTFGRNAYLHFPSDAEPDKRSNWRLGIVSYQLVTHKSSNFHFTGDLSMFPKPIYAELGYSVVSKLKALGLQVKTYPTAMNILEVLAKTKEGSFISVPGNIHVMGKEIKILDQLTIHPVNIYEASYFLPFSRKSKLTANQRQELWNEIANVRTRIYPQM